ncbi:E4 ORF6/7 [Canine adenovirus 1]|uniref:E4 ORF6/7 n=1 Tax=Canine mastadenovirus A TaxID=10537 RepID=A0A6S6MMG3_9ADEN|nr:E4 ORF6/7 [Canine adenovirus 1]BCG66219.1 E4 ORF6/7 [Canine mastadenovirus A]
MEGSCNAETTSHVTAVIEPTVLDYSCIPVDGFVDITDPRFATQENVYYYPSNQLLTNTYVLCSCERTVYRVTFPEGGSITARVYEK